jgi:type I restriction enzyme, S subunit
MSKENNTIYKDSPLGKIPSDWEVKELGCLVKEMKSGLSRELSSEDIGLPVIRSNNLIDNKVDFTDIKFWYKEDNQGANTENYYLVEGDILVNFINSIAQIGKCAFYKDLHNRPVIYTTNLLSVRFDENKIISAYFLNYSLTSHYQKFIDSITKPAVNQASFTTKDYKKLLIPIPPLPEQKTIATLLSTWDKAITTTQKLITQKERQKKWLMQMLLTGKKRLEEFDGAWIKIGAGEVFKSITVKGFNNEELLSATQDRGIIPRNMLEGRVTMPDGTTAGYKLVEPGDFVISLRSFQGGLEYSYYRGIVSPAYIVLKPKQKINAEFYKQYYKSYEFIGRLATAVIGIRDGKQISYDDYCLVRIPFPSYEEQTAIAQVLQAADKEIQLLKAKMEKLKEHKKGLMQVLLTGKKRLNFLEV